MEFQLYRYLARHPLQMRIARWWLRRHLPVPAIIKRQLANEIHAEMIARLMGVVVREGSVTLARALQVHFELGQEIAAQAQDLLSLDPHDAASLSGIIDFLHDLLCISGREVVEDSPARAVSRWRQCPLSAQLRDSKEGGGPFYCHLFQEIYKGVLFGINPKAKANDLDTTQSQGHGYCELHTWIEQVG